MGQAPGQLTASRADIDAVTALAREYIESYVAGDAERHARVYHPECAKRRFVTDPESGVTELITLSPRTMADYAAASGAMAEECPTEVVAVATSEYGPRLGAASSARTRYE